jgi:hypothetical protein
LTETKIRAKEVADESMLGEKGPNVPGQEQTERDPEKDDRGNVYGLEGAAPRSCEKSFSALKH